MGQCGLHLTVLFGILRQWSVSQAPRVTATSVASYGSLKWTGYTGKQLYFFSLWMVKQIHGTDSEMWNMIMPFTRSKSYLTAEVKKKKGKERKIKARKSRRRNGTAIFVWRQLARPVAVAAARDFRGGLLWLVRTNKAVWEHGGAAEWQPLVPIIVKSCCLGTHIHTATNVHVQH